MHPFAQGPILETVKLTGRRPIGWQTLVWTGLAAMALFLMGLRNHTLWDYHEPYVGGIVREMAATGNWLVPTLNGQPFLEKPPLFYALGAFCCRLFGTYHPWVLRLPSALLAMATVVWCSYLGWRLSSARAGAWAGFMVATNALFFQMGHMAVVDMTLAATVTLALGLAFLVIVERPYQRRWAPWFWLSLGLAFMAKGVFGPALVLAPLALVLLARGDRALLAAFLRPNWGMAACLLLVAGWAAALAHLGGKEFLTEVFVRNTIGRFLASPAWVPRTGKLGEHVEPFWFYLARTPGNLLPWVAIWAAALAATFPWRRGQHLDARRAFLPLVFVLDLALLSLSEGKRMVYLLPVLPITFVHAAVWLDLQMPKGRARGGRPLLAVLWCTVLLAGLLGAAFPWVVVARVNLHRGLAVLLSALPVAMTGWAVACLRQRRLPRVLDLAMAQWTLFLLLFMAIGVPELDREWRPILEPFRLARELEARGARVFEGRLTETQLGYASLELQHVLPSVAEPAAVRAALAGPAPVALLLETKFYWREQLRPELGEAAAVPTEAARSHRLWDRAPTLVLNGPAWELIKHKGS